MVGVCGLTVASTGASEKTLRRAGIPYLKIYTHSNNHAGYYPGAGAIDVKLMFSPEAREGRGAGTRADGGAEKGQHKRGRPAFVGSSALGQETCGGLVR